MVDLLFQDLALTITLTDMEKELLRSVLIPKTVEKGQSLLQAGDVCLHAILVAKGCLRSYTIDEKEVKHIFQFAIEGWAISDMYSFLTGEPATYYIDAIEDSELFLMDKAGKEELLDHIPGMEKVFRLSLEKNYIANQRRTNAMLGSSIEERYLSFARTYPKILQRVPQHMVASYLGVSPRTLSRIRKQLAGKGIPGIPVKE
jgi:CRP-like cAMP-binding protein